MKIQANPYKDKDTNDIGRGIDEKKKGTISAQIGENFLEFIKDCQIFYYEPNDSRFAGWKKSQMIRSFVLLAINLLLIGGAICVTIFGSLIFGILELVISSLSLFLSIAMLFLYGRFQPKMEVYSTFNLSNFRFFGEKGCLRHEEKNSSICQFIHYAEVVMAVISFAILVVYIFTYPSGTEMWQITIVEVETVLNGLFCAFCSGCLRMYNYPSFLFEKPDRYVRFTNNKWQLIKK